MEDYEKFIQSCLSRLKKQGEEEHKPAPAVSAIRFHGKSILSPQLSQKKREEMSRYRDAAQKAAVHRNLKKTACMPPTLQNVQLLEMPQEQARPMTDEGSLSGKENDGSSQELLHPVAIDLLVSSSPERAGNNGAYLPHLTSATCNAFFASDVALQQRYQDRCLIDQHISEKRPQPVCLTGLSNQSVSSGYVTHYALENSSCFSRGIGAGKENHGVVSSEGAHDVGAFIFNRTSNAITKTPEIIIYPPLDGVELEKSGLEKMLEKYENSHLDTAKDDDYLPVPSAHDLDKDQSLHTSSDFSDSPPLSQASIAHQVPTAVFHIQQEPTETKSLHNIDKEQLSLKPHSLQALLKKSQECRQHRQILRNQAKNTKIQERIQEHTRARPEERSHSDKENEDLAHMDTVTANQKKLKDKRGALIQSKEVSARESCENHKMTESEFVWNKKNSKTENTHVTGNENWNVGEETTIKNNKLNLSLVLKTQQVNSLQEQPVLTQSSRVLGAFSLTTCHTALQKVSGKPRTVLAPNFSRSPVRIRPINNKDCIQNKSPGGTETSENVLVNAILSENQSFKPQTGCNPGSCTVNLKVSSAAPAESESHTDRFEHSLCGVKELILDLESILTENLGIHSPNSTEMQSEFSFEDKQRDVADGDSDTQTYTKYLQRQPLNDFRNTRECTGAEPSNSDRGNFAVESGKHWLLKTSTTEEAPEKCDVDVLPLNKSHDVAKSYDMDKPSELWFLQGLGSELGSRGRVGPGKHLTPERGCGIQDRVSTVKRRLLMDTKENGADASRGRDSTLGPKSSIPRALVPEDRGVLNKQQQLKQNYAAKIRAVQAEQKRRQEERLQALAVHNSLIQSMPFPRSTSSSCLGDTLTFSTVSQPSRVSPEHYHPLLLAAAKGFLTRRLLKTERVKELVRTIKDTQCLLQTLPQPNSSSSQSSCRDDMLLQKRATLQLRAARYKLNDTFFTLSARERMQIIGWDRELIRERWLRRQGGHMGKPSRKTCLSAATQKTLARKQEVLIQKTNAERHKGVVTKTRPNSGLSANTSKATKFRANPQKVPKNTHCSRTKK